MLAQQLRELSEILVGPVVRGILHFGVLREVTLQDLSDLIDRSGNQTADDLGREFALRTLRLLFDQRDEVAQRLALLVGDLQRRA